MPHVAVHVHRLCSADVVLVLVLAVPVLTGVPRSRALRLVIAGACAVLCCCLCSCWLLQDQQCIGSAHIRYAKSWVDVEPAAVNVAGLSYLCACKLTCLPQGRPRFFFNWPV